MPELPEVEMMVRGLRPALVGRVVGQIEAHDPGMIRRCTATELEDRVRGTTVAAVHRRGKWVVIILDRYAGLIVIQPRMTGGFWLVEPPRPDHIRLTFRIAKPVASVWYCDSRRLGRIHWFPDAGSAAEAFAQSLGPDALEIGADELAARLKRTSRRIKPTLMDQKVLAGIGNIYADEVLFRSRIHPERPAAGLKPEEVRRIHAAIGEVLAEAIAAEGSSFDAGYRTVLGLEGGFLASNAMYGRAGKPCHGCGLPVEKTRIPGLIGRPTYYCPRCQPKTTRRRKPSG